MEKFALRCLGLLFLASVGMTVRADWHDGVTVADPFGARADDVWVSSLARYCDELMSGVFDDAGISNVSRCATGDAATRADVLLSAFKTPENLKNYDFPLQPLCRIRFAIYATAEQAERLRKIPYVSWPRLRLACSTALRDTKDDRLRFFRDNGIPCEELDFPTGADAIEAVREGRADVLFLETSNDSPPSGLARLVDIGERNVYFAVRKDRPGLIDALAKAYRTRYVNCIGEIDALRLRHLGLPTPEKRVRLAAFTRPGILVISGDERREGGLCDWMEVIARETGWTVDWVYGTFAESTADVAAGRLDLVGGVTNSDIRRKEFRFPLTPFARLYIRLWTQPDRPYVPNEITTWKGMRIGCLAGSFKGMQFEKRLKQIGADVTFVYFGYNRDLLNAYHVGEVDAVSSVERLELAYDKVLLVQVPEPVFICTARRNVALCDELTEAIERLHTQDPELVKVLQARYAEHHDGGEPEYSLEEIAWLEARHLEGGVLPVAFTAGTSSDDIATAFGSFVFDELSQRTGLKFRLDRQPDVSVARQKFVKGEVDLWASYPLHAGDLYGVGQKVFDIRLPQLYVRRIGTPANILATGRVAVCAKDCERLDSYSQPGIAERVVKCRDTEDCFRALVDGRADCTFQAFSAEAVIEKLGLGDRLVTEIARTAVHRSKYELIAGPNTPQVLVNILTKTARRIDGQRLRTFFEEQRSRRSEFRFLGLDAAALRTVLNVLAVGGAFALVIIVFILYRAMIQERKARRTVEENAKAKSYFFSIVSHDIRTPLNAILGFSELLQTGTMELEARTHALACIRSSGHVLLDLINDVLDLSRIESGKFDITPCPTDVGELIRESMSAFSVTGKDGVDYTFHADGVPCLLLDPRRVRQVLFNLVGNASKFTEHGSIDVTATYEGGRFRLSVRDTGCGIPEDQIPKLTEAFVRLSDTGERRGAGLGLAICRQLAERMGGQMRIESEVGVGSTFTLDIPAETAPTPARATAANLPQSPEASAQPVCVPKNGRLLVVDDSAVNLTVLKTMLGRLGFTNVVLAHDGREAFEIIQSGQEFDCVITDIWMPRMSGDELVRALRELPPFARLPVFALTADVETGKTSAKDGFTGILLKPITLKRLKDLFGE